MQSYRVYPLDKDGHVNGPPDILTCEDDGTAIEKAKRLVNGHDIEVWYLDRLIIHLPLHKG